MVRTINLSESIRTNCAERLLREISLTAMYIKLMAMFVSRYETEKEIQDNIKPQFDVGYFLTKDYLIQEYCYCEHSEPQMQGYYEKQHGLDKSDLIVIEDGGNNEW